MVIFLGNMIRSETAWEYRTLGHDLRLWQSILGIVLLCLVHVMVPKRWFPACWLATVAITAVFCVLSAFIA